MRGSFDLVYCTLCILSKGTMEDKLSINEMKQTENCKCPLPPPFARRIDILLFLLLVDHLLRNIAYYIIFLWQSGKCNNKNPLYIQFGTCCNTKNDCSVYIYTCTCTQRLITGKWSNHSSFRLFVQILVRPINICISYLSHWSIIMRWCDVYIHDPDTKFTYYLKVKFIGFLAWLRVGAIQRSRSCLL